MWKIAARFFLWSFLVKRFLIVLVCMGLVHGVAVSDPLSDEDIDRKISAYPSVMAAYLELQEVLYNTEELRDETLEAPLNGRFRNNIEMAKNHKVDDYNGIQALALEHGYESIEAWALISDRIVPLFGQMATIGEYPIGFGENSELTADTDIYAYISDETKPIEVRDKISKNLEETCKNHCIEATDLESVGRRYSDILAAYNAFRESLK